MTVYEAIRENNILLLKGLHPKLLLDSGKKMVAMLKKK